MIWKSLSRPPVRGRRDAWAPLLRTGNSARLRGEAGACVLGCLVPIVALFAVFILLGLVVRRDAYHVVDTGERVLRHTHAPVDVWFGPSEAQWIVAHVGAGHPLWAVTLNNGWAAVYEKHGSKRVLGFVPDSLLHDLPASTGDDAAPAQSGRRLRRAAGLAPGLR